jgi:hypothetical protein
MFHKACERSHILGAVELWLVDELLSIAVKRSLLFKSSKIPVETQAGGPKYEYSFQSEKRRASEQKIFEIFEGRELDTFIYLVSGCDVGCQTNSHPGHSVVRSLRRPNSISLTTISSPCYYPRGQGDSRLYGGYHARALDRRRINTIEAMLLELPPSGSSHGMKRSRRSSPECCWVADHWYCNATGLTHRFATAQKIPQHPRALAPKVRWLTYALWITVSK